MASRSPLLAELVVEPSDPDAEPVVVDVVIDPSDPDDPSFADVVVEETDPAMSAPRLPSSWSTLADEFASDVGEAPASGGHQTLVPFDDGAPSLTPAAPGEVSLGLDRAVAAGVVGPSGLASIDEDAATEHGRVGPAPEPPTPAVPTDDLVRRLAPAAVGVFVLVCVAWLVRALLA